MRKLVFFFTLLAFNSFGQFDITRKTANLDSINARTDTVNINSPIRGQLSNWTQILKGDTLLKDYILFYAASPSLTFGTDNQIPFMNAAGSDYEYSPNFTWDGNALEIDNDNSSVYIGKDTRSTNGGGNNNVNIGFESGFNATTGSINSVFIGYRSGYSSVNAENVFIGYKSGQANDGKNNTFIGFSSGISSNSDSSVYVGSEAGGNADGNGNVFIGFEAGRNETGSNKLYIENSNSANPLIYGEFDNDQVKINGYLDADSGVYQVHTGLFGRSDTLNTIAANQWVTIGMDTVIQSVTTSGFELNSDSTGVICRFAGTVQFSGHVNLKNNGASQTDASVFFRLLKNGVEQSIFNSAKRRVYQAGGQDDLTSIVAPVDVSLNDTLYVQGRVTNTNIDIESTNGGVFDGTSPFDISLIQILKKP